MEKNKELSEIKYKGISGELYIQKPEYMTQLYGNILVKKNHKRIIFRGVLDSFISRWLLTVKELESLKSEKLQNDLESVEEYIKKLLISEVTGREFKDIKVLGKTPNELREISHNPRKYFNREHLFVVSSKDSYLVIKFNEMRALSREMEIKGVEAFVGEGREAEREDLLPGLNRLSSIIYVMMLKAITGEYDNN